MVVVGESSCGGVECQGVVGIKGQGGWGQGGEGLLSEYIR